MRQLVICSYWGSNKFNNYSQNDLFSIERKFNIRREINFSFNGIYIPKTIVAFSIKLSKKPKDFNFLKENINCRLGFEVYETQFSNFFFERLKYFVRKKVPKPIYIVIRFILTKIFYKKNYPLVLGKDFSTIYDIRQKKYSGIKILFNEFLLRVRKIEKLNNKPSFTEDELFGNYIDSKKH